jgi:glycosyltransferase involved in cell wall biosynthesis
VIESEGPGGAETIMAELVMRSNQTGERTLAVIPSADSWLAGALPSIAQRFVRPTAGHAGPLDLPYLRSLRRLFVAERPDVVHAHNFDSALYSGLGLLGLPGRLVATFHGASDVRRFGFKNRLKWLTLRRSAALVCVSASLADVARRTPGLPASRLRTILNGVDLSRVSTVRSAGLRTRLGVPDDVMLVGALGNVRAPKGYHFLLRAIGALKGAGIRLHLVIAGDDRGSLGDDLRSLRTTLGLETDVTFLGFTDDPGSYLSNLDLFVLSSTSEGFSLSTVQAMAASLPIVATRSGGPEELIEHDVHGWLVAPGSSEAIAEGIATLLQDESKRLRLSQAARSRALTTFAIETMMAHYNALYQEVRST